MRLEIKNHIGQIKKRKAVVKAYNKTPGIFDIAAHAAHHYAKKDNKPKIVVPGNSYGQKVYHILNEDADLAKYAPGIGKLYVVAGIIHPDGKVFNAFAYAK